MNMKCDLHTHSLYSDGTYTPCELVCEAKEKGLVIALTDHNTTAGLSEFEKAAKEQGIHAVCGVEFSTEFLKNEYHIIGLFISPVYYDRIEKMCEELVVRKEKSNRETVERLCAAGYKIDYANVKKRNNNGNINRAHIAAELVENGYVSSVKEAFENLLFDGGEFYKSPSRLDAVEVISFLKEINAVSVLAHPLKDVDELTLRHFLSFAVKAGLDAIEVMHSSYDECKIATSIALATEYNLLPSGGSDFHGNNKPGISLGVGKGNLDIPYEYYENLLKYHEKSGTF